jgi:carboxypeptidase C (cathepsin A)
MKDCFVVLLIMAALALPAYSQGGRGGRGQSGAPPAAEAPATATPAAPAPKVEEKTSTTSHTIQIGGQSIKYTATAGTVVLRKEDGTATASMFYVAYTKDDVADIGRRPPSWWTTSIPSST